MLDFFRLSLFEGIILVILILVPLVYLLKCDSKVTCWFCHMQTIVPRSKINCWDCPKCEQYNGFTQSGDHNKKIPAHFRREYNSYHNSITPTEFETYSNVMCPDCTRNQALKVHQLSQFEPLDDANWEQELASFRRRLEHAYKLCSKCQRRANDRVRHCDVTVLPKYIEWRKKLSLKHQSKCGMFTVIGCCAAYFLFYTTAFVNMSSTCVLAAGTLNFIEGASRQTNLLTTSTGSTFIHLLLCTVYFRRINMPLLVHFGVMLTLLANQMSVLHIHQADKFSAWCHSLCALLSIGGVLFRVRVPYQPIKTSKQVHSRSTFPSPKSLTPQPTEPSISPSRYSAYTQSHPSRENDTSSFYSCQTANPFLLNKPRTSPSLISEPYGRSIIAQPRFVYKGSSHQSYSPPPSVLSRPSTPESSASKCFPQLTPNHEVGAFLTDESESESNSNESSSIEECSPVPSSLLYRCLIGVLIGVTFTGCLHYIAIPLFEYTKLYARKRFRI